MELNDLIFRGTRVLEVGEGWEAVLQAKRILPGYHRVLRNNWVLVKVREDVVGAEEYRIIEKSS